MPKRVTIIHTVPTLQPVFSRLTDELLPGVEQEHVVDESLLQDAISEGGLTPEISERLASHIRDAEASGADAILVTCSSVGAAAEEAAVSASVPVLRVDEPMVVRAVHSGRRIGVLATLSSTLDPTVDLLRRVASREGRAVEVLPRVVDGAFDALRAGDVERHDALVRAAFDELQSNVDVVLLAQASMARVVDSIPESERRVPVLSSPRLGVERLAEAVKAA
jgi:Asp/Glu/hydantoin racemase